MFVVIIGLLIIIFVTLFIFRVEEDLKKIYKWSMNELEKNREVLQYETN